MKPKVLAASWHPGGMNAIIPVIKRLKEEGLTEVSVLTDDNLTRESLKNKGVDYTTLIDYGLQKPNQNSAIAVLDQENPDLVLVGTSVQNGSLIPTFEKYLIAATNNLGKTSISVLDFWGDYADRFSNPETGERLSFMPTYIAIIDAIAEREMLAEGFSKNKLVITGNPHFDSLEQKAAGFKDSDRSRIRSQLGMSADSIMAFYAANAWKKESHMRGYQDLDNLKIASSVLDDLSDKYFFLVKLHPRVDADEKEDITDFIDSGNANLRLVENIHPHDLVLAADVVYTPFSTLGIESVYLRRPTISLQPNLRGMDPLHVLTESDVIPVGYSEDDCATLIRRGLTDGNYRNELLDKSRSFRTDGRATDRLVDLIYHNLF